ncbi:hypothetical protein Gotri_000046 [Gossypium trilobum]|uniref:Uncharacterized protein n=1 Tax=Gossypium trilobum TaxID=34281 RepID=A0A7J9FLV7_9ROSI|nr:hypothetical protein [Gossypium trilobum]
MDVSSSSVLAAKAYALRLGLKLLHDHQWQQVIMESENKLCIGTLSRDLEHI